MQPQGASTPKNWHNKKCYDMLKAWCPNRHGGVVRCLKALLRQKLVHHDNSRYDGYRLTPLGYDFLALKALVARGAITAVGRQIGVGKESDVFEARVSVYSHIQYSCLAAIMARGISLAHVPGEGYVVACCAWGTIDAEHAPGQAGCCQVHMS